MKKIDIVIIFDDLLKLKILFLKSESGQKPYDFKDQDQNKIFGHKLVNLFRINEKDITRTPVQDEFGDSRANVDFGDGGAIFTASSLINHQTPGTASGFSSSSPVRTNQTPGTSSGFSSSNPDRTIPCS